MLPPSRPVLLRRVLPSIAVSLAVLFGVPASVPAPVTAVVSAEAGRALHGVGVAVPHHEPGTFDFGDDWQFALGDSAGAAWREVHLPHDWSIELNPTAGPGTAAGSGFYPGGLGWYRKTFTLPPSMAGKHLAVEFDGVYMDAEVYLNGRLAGAHHNGYTGFSVDLTGAHTDGRTADVLAVKVRNQVPSSRWYSGSGIYRNVRLVATGPVRVQRLGTAVTTPGLATTAAAGYATVHVTTTIEPAAGQRVRVTSTVRDATGRAVGSARTEATTGDKPVTVASDVRVPRPRLWDVSDPYQYSVTTELAVDGRVADTYVTRTGFRFTRFDPRGGFFLNGRRVKLHGVNLHHDLGALGAAVNRDAIRRQLKIMKSMGVNAVRTSHNPPAPELEQACAELGIMLIVEAFDVWNAGKVANDYARFFAADGDADIAEMVRGARNSPAVIMWSIGNEIPNSGSAEAVPIARRLIDDVRAEDPGRPIVMGSDKYRTVPAAGSPLDRILLMLDGMGLNYNTAGSVDALHARYPRQFFFESESSSQTSTRGGYDQPEQLNTGADHTVGRRTVSSYDNNLASWTMSAEYALKKDRDRPWFLGQFLWSGTDYLGEPTPFEVFPVKASSFGAVDTAGFAKDQFHLFASQWTTAPTVHLLPMDWTDHRPGEPVQVWAYTNADSVELFRNGSSLGVRRFDHKVTADGRPYLETTEPTGDDRTVPGGSYPGGDGTAGHLRLTWTVPYQPGRLVAVAKRGTRVVARDEVRTAGAPAAVRLSADRDTIAADGRSLAYVTAEVVDRDGVTVPDAGDLLTFSVRGGRLVGVDNGRQESAESYKATHRTAFHGRALAIVTPTGTGTGPLTVTAVAAGLRAGAVSVAVTPPDPLDAATVQGQAPPTWFTPDAPTAPVALPPPGAGGLRADAGFTGAEDAQPAEMVDGVTGTGGWSDAFTQEATATLPEISAARPADWVSITWPDRRPVTGVTAWFTVDARHELPATLTVSAWDGQAWRPVDDPKTATGRPTTITFAAVTTTALRLDLTSRHPQSPTGFLGITELAPVSR